MRRVDSDAGRDWGQEEKGTTEDEMAGWYLQLDRHEWVNSGLGDGQGGLACCSPWGCQVVLDTTERLNNNDEPAEHYLLPWHPTPEFKMQSHPRIPKLNMERSSGDAHLVGLVCMTKS